jgi:hypothetical protein
MKKAILLLVLLPCLACGAWERAKQLRTYTNMQGIAGRIEELRLAKGDLSDAKVTELIKSVAEGRDQWGHPFLYRSRVSAAGLSYVLVSFGSDGTSDVKDPDDYFAMPEEDIDGQAARDIVFRDGRPIANAGK